VGLLFVAVLRVEPGPRACPAVPLSHTPAPFVVFSAITPQVLPCGNHRK
jgi:hypothetical protein